MDPQFFYEPDKFIPERFSEENKHLIDLSVFMPFGVGPRMCIGIFFIYSICHQNSILQIIIFKN